MGYTTSCRTPKECVGRASYTSAADQECVGSSTPERISTGSKKRFGGPAEGDASCHHHHQERLGRATSAGPQSRPGKQSASQAADWREPPQAAHGWGTGEAQPMESTSQNNSRKQEGFFRVKGQSFYGRGRGGRGEERRGERKKGRKTPERPPRFQKSLQRGREPDESASWQE